MYRSIVQFNVFHYKSCISNKGILLKLVERGNYFHLDNLYTAKP